MTIGERIKYARESKGISQVKLAAAAKISKQNLYKYENNIITNIPSDKIELISDYMEISPAYIMGWISEIESNPKLPTSEIGKADSNALKVALFGDVEDVTDEMWEDVKRYAKYRRDNK